MKELLTRKETAHYLGMGIATIDRLFRRGEIKPLKIGSMVRYKREELDAFIARQPVKQPLGGKDG